MSASVQTLSADSGEARPGFRDVGNMYFHFLSTRAPPQPAPPAPAQGGMSILYDDNEAGTCPVTCLHWARVPALH